jgi:hypothetical protein
MSILSNSAAKPMGVGKAAKGDVSGFGDVAQGTGLKPETPTMTDEEKALISEQTKALRTQQQVMAQQMHYSVNDDGSWTKMSDEEWYNAPTTTTADKKQWDIYKSQLDRYQSALQGTLPLNKGMQTEKQKEYTSMIGQGISGSTPETAKATDTIGAQRLNNFSTKWTTEQDQEQQAALGMMPSMTASGQALTGIASQNVQNIGATGQYQALLQPYMEYNRAKYQSQAQGTANTIGAIGAGAGLLAAL